MVHERIVIDPKIMFGKPVVRGTRITVELSLRKIGAGMAEHEIIAHHPNGRRHSDGSRFRRRASGG